MSEEAIAPGALPRIGPDGRVERAPPLPGAENVEGRRIAPVERGFGTTWWKRFRVRLPDEGDSSAAMRRWRDGFERYWPDGSRFWRPLSGIRPGEVAGLELGMVAGLRLSTGVIVGAVTPTSFELLTPEGHVYAGRVRFATFPSRAGGTIAEVSMVVRPNDPLYELGNWIVGDLQEDHFWKETLVRLARSSGAPPLVSRRKEIRSRRWNVRAAGNVLHNAGLRTLVQRAVGAIRHAFGLPMRRRRR